jgi:hypothetical protein
MPAPKMDFNLFRRLCGETLRGFLADEISLCRLTEIFTVFTYKTAEWRTL